MPTTIIRKSLSFFLPFLGAGLLAAGLPQSQTGSYTSQTTGAIAQPAPPQLSENSIYEAASYPAFNVPLADGPGRAEVQIYCNTCHTTRYILMQPPLPAAAWEAEVQKMIKVFGVPISEADAQKITQYLQQHYTPDTRK